jgi:Tol biopolymer transport system component
MRVLGVRFALVAIATAASVALAATPAGAAFPGANGKIAFSDYYTDPSGNNEIYAIDPAGTGLVRLTNDAAFDFEPAWSPNGRKIAFASNRAAPGTCANVGPACNYDIYVMNADGSGLVRLTTSLANDRNPAWSPDGSRIVFTSTRDQQGDPPFSQPDQFNSELYVMNADGSGQTRITDYEGVDTDPAWSPDGGRIAFKRGACFFNCVSHIYNVAPTGSGVTQLTSEVTRDRSPNWSPAGDKIVFNREDTANAFWVMNPDGSGQTRLPGTHLEPAWSPDGQKIAFSYPGIGIMNPDGGSAATIYPNGEAPDWQPLVAPRRSDFKTANEFCRAEREFLGEAQFQQKYGGGTNAFGRCLRQNK